MSDYLLKSLIAIVLLGAGSAAFLSMMALMGKAERKTDPVRLRKLHHAAGYAYLVLLAPLVYFGAVFLSELGDGLTVRAAFHFVLAAALLILVLLKLLVVRVYKQFLKYAPGLGIAVFALTLVIFLITAGYFFLRGAILD